MKWCWIIDVSSLHLEVIVSSRLTFSVFMWPKQQVKLEEYGRPKIDGELKVSSIVNRTKQDRWVHTTENNHPTNMRNKVTCILTAVNCVCVSRYIFLFDKVVIVCKRKGYCYELKEIIELQSYKMSDDPMNNRDVKKVRTILLLCITFKKKRPLMKHSV